MLIIWIGCVVLDKNKPCTLWDPGERVWGNPVLIPLLISPLIYRPVWFFDSSFSCSTGKPPPNLAQGVPPLLANQYIMGPGGLLPAYPVTTLALFFSCMLSIFVSMNSHPFLFTSLVFPKSFSHWPAIAPFLALSSLSYLFGSRLNMWILLVDLFHLVIVPL